MGLAGWLGPSPIPILQPGIYGCAFLRIQPAQDKECDRWFCWRTNWFTEIDKELNCAGTVHTQRSTAPGP